MAFAEVDNLHNTLRRFAERTNDLVSSANNNLENLVTHCPSHSALLPSPTSITDIMNLDVFSAKRPRVQFAQAGPSTKPQRALLLRPILPVEILDAIFCLLKQHQLSPVLLSNTFLYQIARRRFYNTVTLRSPKHTIAFLKTISHNLELSPLVRTFDLGVVVQTGKKHAVVGHPPTSSSPTAPQPPNHDSASTTSPHFTYNFYRLLHRGLRSMGSLLSLNLELPKVHSPVWVFDDCTFMLRQFTTSMHCNHQLAKFLEKQDMIEDLTLRGFQTESLFFLPFLGATAAALVSQAPAGPSGTTSSTTHNPIPFSLSPSALSRLKSFNAIHAGPSIIHTIMRGRSIEIASIPLFPERSLPTLDALGSGKKALKRLSVISFDPGAPEFLFEELARRFQDLEALHLVLLMADYSNTLFEEYSRILSSFTSLKYITFMAASSNESSIDEVQIARDWHRACPTLRTIILPKGSVWFQGEADRQMQEIDPDSSSSGGSSVEG